MYAFIHDRIIGNVYNGQQYKDLVYGQVVNPLLEILHCVNYKALYSYLDSFVKQPLLKIFPKHYGNS
jgi:hypothetical protein